MGQWKKLFRGRLGRLHYFLGVIAVSFVFGFISIFIFGILDLLGLENIIIDIMISCLPMVIAIYSLICRRLQDMNVNGKFGLIIAFFMFFYVIIGDDLGRILPFFGVVRTVLNLIALVLILGPGTRGENNYGSRPQKSRKLMDAVLNI